MCSIREINRKRLVVVGDGTCGKTCLLLVFKNNEFPEGYVPTVFEEYVVDMTLSKTKKVQVILRDTAGQEDFDTIRTFSYDDVDVILICFSIGFPDSLANVREKWWPEARAECPGVPIILVGNKKDLRTDEATIAELGRMGQHPVTYEEGITMAHQIKAVDYIETSAIWTENVQLVFEQAVRCTLKAETKSKRKPICQVL